jgi:hypothetical protein
MPSFKFLSHQERSDGFILVAVLWILAALATLAAIYSVYVNETASVLVMMKDFRRRSWHWPGSSSPSIN